MAPALDAVTLMSMRKRSAHSGPSTHVLDAAVAARLAAIQASGFLPS